MRASVLLPILVVGPTLFFYQNCANNYRSVELSDNEVMVGDMIVSKSAVENWKKLDIPEFENSGMSEEGYNEYVDEQINSLISSDDDLEDAPVKNEAVKRRIDRTWPSGIIYYQFSKSFTSAEKSIFKSACQELGYFAKVSCVESSNKSGRLLIVRGTGCAASLGYSPPGFGNNRMYLARGCFNWKDTIQHELLHSFGLMHEHVHMDARSYLTINWANIISDKKYNFYPLYYSTGTKLTTYDSKSIMHYASYSFSKNKRMTIKPKFKKAQEWSLQPSYKDHYALTKLYGARRTLNTSTYDKFYNGQLVTFTSGCKVRTVEGEYAPIRVGSTECMRVDRAVSAQYLGTEYCPRGNTKRGYYWRKHSNGKTYSLHFHCNGYFKVTIKKGPRNSESWYRYTDQDRNYFIGL